MSRLIAFVAIVSGVAGLAALLHRWPAQTAITCFVLGVLFLCWVIADAFFGPLPANDDPSSSPHGPRTM